MAEKMDSADSTYASADLLINIVIWAAFAVLIYKMVCLALPLRVNAEATGFEGFWNRKWQVSRVTGRVFWSDPKAMAQFAVGRHPDGTPYARSQVDVRETIRLQMLDGRLDDFQIVNFNVNPGRGDVLTLCYARCEKRGDTIAVLNHTTNRQFTNEASLFQLLEPHGGTYVVIGSILLAFIGVFTGCILLIPGFALMILYYKRKQRVRRNFGLPGRESGIVALWDRSAAEAAALMSTR
ncbi:hypothetical protein [Nocardia inohanensis]|uniref:hypothetical protein n=1 Tax=Nocardia inohanensis TaxID=209246 RepID=UPI000A8CB8C7|nr:hypothetical protein [Nocardia inohanensis]